MDDRKDEKIFDIDGYLGKEPEEAQAEPEKTPVDSETAGEMGAEAVDVANKTAVDPVQLKYRRNRILVALVAGGILLIAGVFVLIDQIDRNNFRARSRESHEGVLATLADSEKAFNNAFRDYSRKVFGLNGAPQSNDIYPTDEELENAKLSCLEHFDIGFGELSLLDNRNEERDDYVEVDDELNRIIANYSDATISLEDCRQDILSPIATDFGIVYGEISFEEAGGRYRIIMPSKIGYSGSRKIESATVSFAPYDKNGAVIAGYKDYMVHKFDASINSMKKLDFDPFLITAENGGITRQTAPYSEKSKLEHSTIGIYSITGKFQAK